MSDIFDEEEQDELFNVHFIEQMAAKARDFAEVLVKFDNSLRKKGMSSIKSTILVTVMAPILWSHLFEPNNLVIEIDEDEV